MDCLGKIFPQIPIPLRFFLKPFRMKLEPHAETGARIVKSFHKPILGMRHGFETRRKAAKTLMMVAIHSQNTPVIPLL